MLVAGLLLAAGSVAYGGDNTEFAVMEQQRDYPVRGTSSGRVLELFGEPNTRSGPVGDPPISTWQYDSFSVYFEHELVITTVAQEDRLPNKLHDIQ